MTVVEALAPTAVAFRLIGDFIQTHADSQHERDVHAWSNRDDVRLLVDYRRDAQGDRIQRHEDPFSSRRTTPGNVSTHRIAVRRWQSYGRSLRQGSPARW